MITHEIKLTSEEVAALEYALYLHLGCTRCSVTVKELKKLLPIVDTLKAAMADERYEEMMANQEGIDPGRTM